MTDFPKQMTRQQMQDEAVIISSLLTTTQAISGGFKSADGLTLVDMAQERAAALNIALDSVNEVAS